MNLRKADIYLIISISLMIIYTIVDRIILVTTRLSNDTLTTCFFTAFGTEIASCCIIKVFNIRNENNIQIDPEPITSKGEGVG